MKRRHLLKYGTYAACGYGLTACQQFTKGKTPRQDSSAEATPLLTAPADSFGTPEKKKLALGYEPTISIAPWMVAIEQGYFEKYGLEVSLYKQPTAAEVEQGLVESRFDAAITPFSTPLINQLKSPRIDFVALMQVHRHGSAITLGQEAWDNNIRSGIDYANFEEFADAYRDYLRSQPSKSFGVDNLYSVGAYVYRYWWAAMGFHPELDIELLEFAPTQLRYKLQAKAIQGYGSTDPWGQQAIEKRLGYTAYHTGEIWQGHPGAVVTASSGWVEENPNTAKALIAATLMGCQYCQDAVNGSTVAKLLSEPLDTHSSNIKTLLDGQYFYGGSGDRPISRKDSPIWFDLGQRLTPPDNANYCWQSHGLWLLTQMTRWQHFELRSYPDNAETLVEAAYPTKPYADVAKAFSISLPKKSSKTEAPLIDQRGFDPDQPVRYLNQFKIRT
ncbi:MAG: ABC transporter substrate-binding protein [Limnothrix sp. RL_2_0]|nr:ABC transporter substrate-binding protein [Limnothrix sp. RL_2_0]